jgi:DNA-binding MarR family transcriptional regulator
MSAGELAKSLGLTTGAITSVIDRLERAGIVRRVADPKDRRKVVVELVPEHLAATYRVYAPMAAAARALNARHTDKELELLIQYLEDSAALLLREAANLRARRTGIE